MEKLPLLLELGKRGAQNRILVSTSDLSATLAVSQQTISRELRALENAGFIARQPTPQGTTIQLTASGIKQLREVHAGLSTVLAHHHELTGTLFDGLGEGHYYMRQQGYKTQFTKLLGYTPYPGTLNLTVHPTDKETFLATLAKHTLAGFTTKERTFGGLDVYPITLSKTQAAIIRPHRSVHPPTVVEIIAPVHLKSTLNLKRGASLTLAK